MDITEAIILAGGLGTRLRSVVSDLPKCMAPVNGKPFLSYLIHYLQDEGIQEFIFSLGYKNDVITAFLNKEFPHLHFKTSIEAEPLGTGGAVKKACSLANEKNVLITNGDTFYKVNIALLSEAHKVTGADCSLALKPMKNFDRYGVVEIDKDSTITSFKEKRFYESGLINGGIYALNKDQFLAENLPEKFSLETDYLEKFYRSRKMTGLVQDEYFIDIGMPADYARVQADLLEHKLHT